MNPAHGKNVGDRAADERPFPDQGAGHASAAAPGTVPLR